MVSGTRDPGAGQPDLVGQRLTLEPNQVLNQVCVDIVIQRHAQTPQHRLQFRIEFIELLQRIVLSSFQFLEQVTGLKIGGMRGGRG